MPLVTLPDGSQVYLSDEEYAEFRSVTEDRVQQPKPGMNLAQGIKTASDLTDLAEGLNIFPGSSNAAGNIDWSPGSSSILGSLGLGGTTAAPGAGSSLGGSLASGASTATPASFGLADVAGGIGGAYGLYDLLKNKRSGLGGAIQGGISGGLLGSATAGGLAALGTTVAPGVGTAIGAALGLGLGYFGNLGDEDRFQDEYKRAQALRDKGIDWKLNVEKPTQGRSVDELIALENEKVKAGKYGNPAFAASRSEADLKPEDIWGYSVFGEKFGKDWMGTTEAARRAIAAEALKSGGVREHHGTIDINFTPELEKFAADILAKPPSDPNQPNTQSQQRPNTPPPPPMQRPTKPRPPRSPYPGDGLPQGPTAAQQMAPYQASPYSLMGNPLSYENMLKTMQRRAFGFQR